MPTPATPDDKTLPGDEDADSTDESRPDSSWSLDRLGEFATEEVNNSFFAEKAAIFQAHKSAVYLFRAGHALFLARERCKGEKHGDWTKFKQKYTLADTSVNDAIRLFENAKIEDALVGLGITEAKKKFVYPPKQAVTSPASPVKKPHKKTAKTSSQQPKTALTQGANVPSPHPHAQSNGTTATSPDPAAPDVESEPASAPEEPEVSFTTALIEELEEIAQRLAEIAQDDFGKATWTKAEAQQATNAVRSMHSTLKNIQRRITNEEYR